ncbi:uncharacterized protein I206_102942 [Kwoniella pini CBS 10737]|uniref:Uncharacterized protein n=1 Tax=Kwoniella pini CBS 10737 TaxID=1296096 RepID=A0A1B9I6R8_9TREE|nr:uncharacterized protein I206_03293 [Kwoniella pini CBS 10737]OCF51227.1 hypothetical protein I206_03293 [Kwoniella pini CBS 10737]
MTNQLKSTQRINENDIPHTPQEEEIQQFFNSSPMTSPNLINKELDFNDIHNKSEDKKISKEKRKYSNGLYKWTQQLWQNNIDSNKRKLSTSSVQSNQSTLSLESSSSEKM